MRSIGGVIILALVTAASVWAHDAGPVFTPYGLGMYRLRFEYLSLTNAGDSTFTAANYQNRLAYKVGLKAKVNDQVSGQFEIGNDWFATEEVSGIPGNYYKKRSPWSPWFSLAFMQWDPGFLHLQAGILPVKGSALMDLIGFSILFDRQYGLSQTSGSWGAAHLSWGVVTSFGMAGVRLGAPIVKGDFSVGADLFTTVLEQRLLKAVYQDLEFNGSSAMFILDVPIAYKGLTLNPQFVPIFNRNFDKVGGGNDESDNELGFGLDAGYKVNDAVSFRAGFGMAMVSNENTWDATDSVPAAVPNSVDGVLDNGLPVREVANRAVPLYDRTGTNIMVGTSVKLGPGKLDLDLILSTADDDEAAAPAAAIYPFVDLKYGWGVNRNFVISPRVRIFLSSYENESASVTVWPELMLFGSF